jgi:hypothetical protein
MRPAAAEKDRSEPIGGTRRFDALLAFVLAVGTLFLSIYVIGAKLFLVYVYGWSRVRAEALTLVSMPKGRPWVVSNGDALADHQLHFVISLACWFALFLATYLPLRLLLPRAKKVA